MYTKRFTCLRINRLQGAFRELVSSQTPEPVGRSDSRRTHPRQSLISLIKTVLVWDERDEDSVLMRVIKSSTWHVELFICKFNQMSQTFQGYFTRFYLLETNLSATKWRRFARLLFSRFIAEPSFRVRRCVCGVFLSTTKWDEVAGTSLSPWTFC